MQPFLSIIIPSFNESENIAKGSLNELDKYLSSLKYNWEVILVDDGSTDGTLGDLQKWIKGRKNWQLIINSHQGNPEF